MLDLLEAFTGSRGFTMKVLLLTLFFLTAGNDTSFMYSIVIESSFDDSASLYILEALDFFDILSKLDLPDI